MARARNIKPGFFQNEDLAELEPIARLAFIGMWTIADYKGCIEYRPKRLKVQILPYDDCSMDEIVSALDKSGFIQTYSVSGQVYIKIANFEKHQNPHKNERDSGSDIPDFDGNAFKYNVLEKIAINPERNGTAPADSLIPLTDPPILIPSSGDVTAPQPVAPKKPAEPKQETELQLACKATWAAYSAAYLYRYGTEPLRNAQVSSQIKSFCQKLPHSEAPEVAAFYVTHNDAFYIRKAHDVGLLVTDAAKLRTEWATGNRVTAAKARQMDSTSSMLDAAEQIKREMRGEQ